MILIEVGNAERKISVEQGVLRVPFTSAVQRPRPFTFPFTAVASSRREEGRGVLARGGGALGLCRVVSAGRRAKAKGQPCWEPA